MVYYGDDPFSATHKHKHTYITHRRARITTVAANENWPLCTLTYIVRRPRAIRHWLRLFWRCGESATAVLLLVRGTACV